MKQSLLEVFYFHIFINLEIFKEKTKLVIKESHGSMENLLIHANFEKNTTTDDGNSWEDVIEKAVREPSLIISQI